MKKSTILAALMTMALLSTNSFGEDKKKAMAMTPEQRQNMATAHDKMATCLRSDKSIEDCRKEMMESCEQNMGKDGCYMMGKKGKMDKIKSKAHEMKEKSKEMIQDAKE